MSETTSQPCHKENVREHLQQVHRLLDKHALQEMAAHQQEMPRTERHELEGKVRHKRQLSGLREMLGGLHSADIAYILEALPIEQRLLVWDMVKADRDGKILNNVSDAVRESLISTMNRDELRDATAQLDTDEIADLAPNLPQEVIRDVFKSLSIEEREQLRAVMSYSANTVGALMDFGIVTIHEDVTLKVVSRYLRHFNKLPEYTDQLFVVNRDDIFKGVLPLNALLTNEPDMPIAPLVILDTIKFQPDENVGEAAQVFERYKLVSAPVVDEDGKLVGRVTVNSIMGYNRSKSKNDVLGQVGLRREEDIFSPMWKSVQNRWLWLALNLCVVFFVSRVISSFEHSIEKFVALATLMPIVASMAINSGNQTTAIIIRLLALEQILPAHSRRLIVKELAIAVLNSLALGGVSGVFAYTLYSSVSLGLVMAGAMVLSMLLGTLIGILLPLAMHRMGRATSTGTSVLLTAVTNSSGYFIFLGLATIFLIH